MKVAAAVLSTVLASMTAAQEGDRPPPPDPTLIMSAAEADASVPRRVLVRTDEAHDGYTLFAPLNGEKVYLVDLYGEIVHEWATDSAPGASFYLLDDGTLLRCGREDEDPEFRGGGIGGRVQKLAADGSVIWQYGLATDTNQQHHDVEPLPNGNILVITWERISREDAIALGRDPEHVGAAGLWPDAIFEVKPTPPEGGVVVWKWRAWDHLIQDSDPELAGFGSVPDHPELIDINADHRDVPPMTEAQKREQEAMEKQLRRLGYIGGAAEDADADADEGRDRARLDRSGDWLHTNSVAYHPELDLIAMSTPRLNEVWVIDHSTTTEEAESHRGGRWNKGGDLLWRWGNPRTYGAGAEADQQLFAQHDATWVTGANGEPRLLVFNNGGKRPDGKYSSVDELVLPFDPDGGFSREASQPFGPSAPDWTFADPDAFFSAFISGAQRLANGNTLICSGAPGRLFEVTREGNIVWDFRNPYGGEVDPPEHAGRAPPLALFRGTRLSRDHPGVLALLR